MGWDGMGWDGPTQTEGLGWKSLSHPRCELRVPPQILQKLKGLALETEAELERQDEALESIGSAVDRATLTIERQNRRVRRLT